MDLENHIRPDGVKRDLAAANERRPSGVLPCGRFVAAATQRMRPANLPCR